jgi:type IV secretory pathway TrbD component
VSDLLLIGLALFVVKIGLIVWATRTDPEEES